MIREGAAVVLADIKAGDEVKIQVDYTNRRTVYKDWFEVERLGTLVAGPWVLSDPNLTIIAHKFERKVEVTLGTPLDGKHRPYSSRSSTLAAYVCSPHNITFWLPSTEVGVWLTDAEASRLALDILATVGVEE